MASPRTVVSMVGSHNLLGYREIADMLNYFF